MTNNNGEDLFVTLVASHPTCEAPFYDSDSHPGECFFKRVPLKRLVLWTEVVEHVEVIWVHAQF